MRRTFEDRCGKRPCVTSNRITDVNFSELKRKKVQISGTYLMLCVFGLAVVAAFASATGKGNKNNTKDGEGHYFLKVP